ncbi:hypothetical protein E2C01_034992 [Portunus trituberculatus]|uniref:Uncharacterized protein n=1 Tax=Portunus trituberculatus TaxID=210409 RepID=A0A5B7F4C7_PORTR|nr:hypothetical protein [Portunus trituberculatus]
MKQNTRQQRKHHPYPPMHRLRLRGEILSRLPRKSPTSSSEAETSSAEENDSLHPSEGMLAQPLPAPRLNTATVLHVLQQEARSLQGTANTCLCI